MHRIDTLTHTHKFQYDARNSLPEYSLKSMPFSSTHLTHGTRDAKVKSYMNSSASK